MKKVLIIGMDPSFIDFSDPDIPKGVTANVIEQGTRATLQKLQVSGYDAEVFLIEGPFADLKELESMLKERGYTGVVIGNGIRSVRSNFLLFEKVVNTVHANAPGTKIIFNSIPGDTIEAIERWL